MNFIFRRGTVLLIIACFVTSTLVSFASEARASTQSDLIAEVYNTLVGQHYKAANRERMTEAAIEAMISTFDDPYTEYYNAQEWKEYEAMLENEYVGIGIQIENDENGYYVYRVFPGSPAAKSGVRVNDYIVAVNNIAVKEMEELDFYNRITGTEGTTVSLKLKRLEKRLTLSIKRAKIEVSPIANRYFGQGIGYLEISGFDSDILSEFVKQWRLLRKNNIKSLIVDLRNNSGGYLDSTLDLAQYFIPNKVLLREVDRAGNKTPFTASNDEANPDLLINVPIYILVNEESASAAEVFAAALQDYKKATLIGVKTYGKGSVQQLFPVGNGSMLKVTVRKYVTPLSKQVDKVGVSPNVRVDYAPAQLIKALQLSGLTSLKLTIDNRQVMFVNGFESNERVQLIREKGNTYVPARLASALLKNGQITALAKDKLQLSHSAGTALFTPSNGLLARNGTNYIALASLVKRLPMLRYNASAGNIILSN
jgi:carboxyl-terminal processing protease